MAEKKYSTKCTNDIIKIIVYVVFMTTLFLFYCNNNKNDEIENSIDYYHLYNNEVLPSTENGNKNMKIVYIYVILSTIILVVFNK